MIKKPRKIPLKILKLEALLRRLPSDHPKRNQLKEDLAKNKAGYNGEKAIDYHLLLLPDDKYTILHDIRIPHNNTHYFQIDSLIITPKYLLILEVKNINGSLHFDQTFHQLIRTINEGEEAFPDPILQVQRQTSQLRMWLEKHKFPSIPICSFVVISNPSTIIKAAPNKVVIHAASLPHKINKLDKFYTQDILTLKEIKKLSNLLTKQHQPLDQNILQHYHIPQTDIITGVYCPECFHISMIRKRGKWFCPQCLNLSRDTHIPSLKDYSFLIGKEITNQQAREFLNITSITVTKKLLLSSNLQYSGDKKGRKYKLIFPET
ncbi:nuclease-related domain-containing protein [Alkalihalobacterium alkalinitrilicum]|uniref:nuclease-related domain-containing protein n=1 Tax=Alkalihalobacterium alkalinitrilicum TaxID=427920 RepID=UPI00130327D1|nr:nuclease-related domain-containing protein [Alkalihalobacterium alkalinitrilicum]